MQETTGADAHAGAYFCAGFSNGNTCAAHTYIGTRNSLSSAASAHANATHSLSSATHTYTDAAHSLSYWISAGRCLPLQMLNKKLVIALLLSWAVLTSGCTASKIEIDNSQERLDKAAPIITGPQTVGQTFVSHYPNLSAVEVLLVVYPGADAPRTLTFHLRSDPQDKTDIVTLAVDISALKHNEPCRFSFAPQAGSENKTYYFFLEAPEGNNTTVWYNSLNAYGEGELYLGGQPREGDLYFKTYYDYTLDVIGRDIWRGLRDSGWLALPLLALFILPGYLLCSLLLTEPMSDPLEHLALVVGLSMALVPLVFLFCSVVGFALNRARVLVVTLALGVGALWRMKALSTAQHIFTSGFSCSWRTLACLLQQPVKGGLLARLRCSPSEKLSANFCQVVAFLFIFLLSLTVRFLHIRNLVVPAWIDSVHHTLITQLMVAKGGVPRSYEPLLPIGEFIYHFGFHSLVAVFHWLTGMEIPSAMLIVGQVINGLMVLSAYLLAKCLTDRRLAGLFAALIVGLISLMPAYYVSWGRYTQLTGLVLLPSAIAFLIRGIARKPGSLMLAAISAAGLLLTHYRVLIFYGGFVLAYLLYGTITHRHEIETIVRCWGRAATMCLLASLLTLPWLVNLTRVVWPLTTLPSRMQGSPSYNAFPYDLVMIKNNRVLIVLSLCGLLWGLYKRERGVILTVLWVAIVAVIANPTILGLPSTWLVNNASLAISLFVPLSVLGGYALTSLQRPISNLQSLVSKLQWLILGVAVALVALWGAWEMLDIINPSTVLATRDDMVAMGWIRGHIPPEAKFLINVRHWQVGTYVGTDGGYWIPLLTGRDTVLPPAVYLYGPAEYVEGINDLAKAIAAAESWDAESTRRLLSDSGVTHVYIGARGGGIIPQMLVDSPYYRPVYSSGPVWIFQVEE